MSAKLKDKVAIVTGSGRGIGRSIAMALVAEGARLIINDINPDTAAATAKAISDVGGKAVAHTCDITDFEEARRLAQRAVDEFGTLDILVNNAGIVKYGMIWDLAENDFDSVVSVCLKGTFNCTHHASKIMKQNRSGRIISAASAAAQGRMMHSNYCAAKAGIIGFTKAVALDLGRFGITCNVYCPGAQTQLAPEEQRAKYFGSMLEAGLMTEEQYEHNLRALPSPDAVAPLVVYLCTDEASDITGQVFHIVGGKLGLYKESQSETIIKKEGFWSLEEIAREIPRTLLVDYQSPLKTQLPYTTKTNA
ncbi:MAG: SDR family oxidoreductase [Chloroflexi bacterium]|nr:SDR family oxidoreductase [Chloroflexota bacterium]